MVNKVHLVWLLMILIRIAVVIFEILTSVNLYMIPGFLFIAHVAFSGMILGMHISESRWEGSYDMDVKPHHKQYMDLFTCNIFIITTIEIIRAYA